MSRKTTMDWARMRPRASVAANVSAPDSAPAPPPPAPVVIVAPPPRAAEVSPAPRDACGDHDTLTVCDRILLAACALDAADTFAVEALVVRAWTMFPRRFSLRIPESPESYPHSVAVFCKLGRLVSDGLLDFRHDSVYAVTPAGRTRAKALRTWLQRGAAGPKPGRDETRAA